MEQDTSSNTTVQANHKWMAVLVIVCLSIVTYGYMYSENKTGNISFLLGENLVNVIFIWGIVSSTQFSAKNKAR
jgi:hypothetical protein